MQQADDRSINNPQERALVADREPTQREPEVLTLTEASDFICVSPRTMERYVQEGLIPHLRLPHRGKRALIRFLRPELSRWLRERMVRPLHLKHNGCYR